MYIFYANHFLYVLQNSVCSIKLNYRGCMMSMPLVPIMSMPRILWWTLLVHTSGSYKWWKTLTGSIFEMKPFIPAVNKPGGGLVSLLCSQFDSKQHCEQFITPQSCFSQPTHRRWWLLQEGGYYKRVGITRGWVL